MRCALRSSGASCSWIALDLRLVRIFTEGALYIMQRLLYLALALWQTVRTVASAPSDDA